MLHSLSGRASIHACHNCPVSSSGGYGDYKANHLRQMIRSSIISLLLLLLYSCNGEAPPSEDVVTAPSRDPGIARLTEAINADPTNADLYAQRASMEYDKKNYDAAIADMAKALSIDSTNIEYHYNLADVYLDYYRSRLALRTLERASSLEPNNVETMLRLAETELTLKQYDDALVTLSEISKIDPRNPDVFYLLSQTFLETGDTARAINSVKEATEIDPDFTDAFIKTGQLLFAKGLPRAGQYFDAAVAIDPEDPIALHAKADYLRDNDQIGEAIKTYRAASLADRQYVAGYFNAGLLYLEQDSLQPALSEFNLVIKNDPVHIRGFFFRGYTHEQLGDPEAACRDYDVALRFAPDYQLAMDGYARLGCK
ncbi:tetratricopeptide repeat protein [Neolewinella aurantiaca]|uniref:Tetratricopeptide repeat protein n=1 Tax=Neolewinella aurantiaca TaxID=2602767 RepID=A0A5C7FUC3_9BACT|nr:tetratricopeptide repeat protein [Neolewinella aurantiaca]TXF90152.1 tetratricopeptide repeat protein [Neolewinella aurantiaca]